MGTRRDRFDYILIETTGLANPGPVAASLWTDTELESAIRLDSIITVVDAKNITRHLELDIYHAQTNEAQQQLAYADMILLNKARTPNLLFHSEKDIHLPRWIWCPQKRPARFNRCFSP